MAKKRLYEIAKELGRTSNEVIDVLAKQKISKTNFSALEDKEVEIIKRAFASGSVQSPTSVSKPVFTLVRKAHIEEKKQAAEEKQAEEPKKGEEQKKIEETKKVEQSKQVEAKPREAEKKVEEPKKVEQPKIAQQQKPVEQVKNNGQQKPAEQQKPKDQHRDGQNKQNQGQNRQQGQQNRQNGQNNQSGQKQQNRPQGQNNRPQGQGNNNERRNDRNNRNDRNDRNDRNNRNDRNDRNDRNNRNNNNRDFNRDGNRDNRVNNRDNNRNNNRDNRNDNRNRDNRNNAGQKPFNRDGGKPLGQKPNFDKNRSNKFNVEKNDKKVVEHTFISERERSDRDRERNRANNKNYKDKKFAGSYATKESRPNRSKGHEMFPDRPKKQQPVKEVVRPTSVKVGQSISVKTFSQMIKREVAEVIKKLFLLGMMVTINQEIDFDTAVLIGDEFGCQVLPEAPEIDLTEVPEVEDDPALRMPRPPVVTVMGHVDHGKTSLLDAIRKTNVTAREAGGITQRIGAYKVNYNNKTIVFLDTPGHEAFTAMRARGAQVTDVAVLVVAADDGVMPQTVEAINHAKAAKVPIIVAINKIDKQEANPDHVKQQLAEHELVPEDWGGDTIMVPVSAYQKTGISDLLEMIQLVADMGDLKANPDLPAKGTIIEAQLDKGRGPVATVLVQRGTLNIGDSIIAGTCYGKVRAMVNDRGEKVTQALPSTPVEVLGLNDVPQAGDVLDVTDERIARIVAEKRIAKQRENELKTAGKVSLDDLFQRIQEGEIKDLNIVVKADVQGSVEALKQSLEKIKNDEVKVVVVHSGVGAITESDIMLASAANALVIGFNVRPDANARKAAESEKVDMRMYRVIYDALEDVEAAIKGMLDPKFKEVIQGRVEVRQIIRISKLVIAGCYVLEGKVTRSSKVRVVRDGIVIHEGEIESLRRFKDDVKEVQQGFECGLTLEKFVDIRENDQLEIFNMEEIAVE